MCRLNLWASHSQKHAASSLRLRTGRFKTWSDEWMWCSCNSHHFTRDYAYFPTLSCIKSLYFSQEWNRRTLWRWECVEALLRWMLSACPNCHLLIFWFSVDVRVRHLLLSLLVFHSLKTLWDYYYTSVQKRADVWTTWDVAYDEVFLCSCMNVWVSPQYACIGLHTGLFMTASVKPICIISAGWCDCILALQALFIGAYSIIPPCEFSPCKSLTIGPLWWYKGPRIKHGACGSASQRRGEDGVTLTSTKTTLISNTRLCLLRLLLVSPWQHCALLPVAVETQCA